MKYLSNESSDVDKIKKNKHYYSILVNIHWIKSDKRENSTITKSKEKTERITKKKYAIDNKILIFI